MKLSDYLEAEGISQGEFATKAGVSHTAVSRALSGDRLPGRNVMERIFRATGGRVTPNDFFNLNGSMEAAQ